MITCGRWPVGVCSWSLDNDRNALKQLSEECGLDHIHLALDPALGTNGAAYLHEVLKENWKISATMIGFDQEDYSSPESIRRSGGIVPDEHWPQNKQKALDAIDLTANLPTPYLEFHFGFLENDDVAQQQVFAQRVGQLADYAASKQVTLLMETGQETADELLTFLERINHPALAVNFDPANMILYNKGTPVEAVKILGSYIRHVHIKDALYPSQPGTWGTEVPWGQGDVDAQNFLNILKGIGFEGTLSVEREAGMDRIQDIKQALQSLAGFTG